MKKVQKNIFLITIILFSGIIIFSLVNICKWMIDVKNVQKNLKDIKSEVTEVEVIDTENTEIIENDSPKENPYWDYIKMNLIDVDFTKLLEINSDTVGWLQVNGTNINYPVVQYTDNKYYLSHTFDKSYNIAGWVYEDYRNDATNDKNTIIYGHNRYDRTMFGTLNDIVKDSWLSDTNNHVIKMSNENENTLWQVFSVYIVPKTNDYLKTNFQNDEEFKEFTDMLIERSFYDFKTTVSTSDKMITLSTCNRHVNRVVLHAKLIKRESKK